MTVSVFLSHNTKDKAFVERLARDLDNHAVKYWLDKAEIKVGDSLIEKIRSGLDEVDYFNWQLICHNYFIARETELLSLVYLLLN